jgi:Spy/CpxP family protein refolding chaperone
LSNNVFSPGRRYRQYITPEQRQKMIKDYIRARAAYRRSLEEGRRDHQELVRLGLIRADSKSEQ